MKKPRRRVSDEAPPEKDGGAGVREPRKPKPKQPGGAAEKPLVAAP